MSGLSFLGTQITYQGETITIRAIFLVYTIDLQARAIILDMIAHNGYCSCSHCDDPAPQNRKGRKQHAFAFNGEGSSRSSDQWKRDAQEAERTGKMVGVRGLNISLSEGLLQ